MPGTARHHKSRVRQLPRTQGCQHIINISGHPGNNADITGLNQPQEYFAYPAAYDQIGPQFDQLGGLPCRVNVSSCNFTTPQFPTRLNLNQKKITAPVKNRGNAIFKYRYGCLHCIFSRRLASGLFVVRSVASLTLRLPPGPLPEKQLPNIRSINGFHKGLHSVCHSAWPADIRYKLLILRNIIRRWRNGQSRGF
jgi:hypothetical protein